MKSPAFFTMPWDTVVFLTITTAGFGFTLQRLHQPQFDSPLPLNDKAETSFSRTERSARQPVDLGCLDDSANAQQISVKDGSVRLKGSLCRLPQKTLRSLEGIRIRNLTNGYEGTVFLHSSNNAFVSDYIVLSAGKNEVQVEWRKQRNAQPETFVAFVYEK